MPYTALELIRCTKIETFIAHQKYAIKVSPFHYDTDDLSVIVLTSS